MSDLICSKTQFLLTHLSFCLHQRSAPSKQNRLEGEDGASPPDPRAHTRALPLPTEESTRHGHPGTTDTRAVLPVISIYFYVPSIAAQREQISSASETAPAEELAPRRSVFGGVYSGVAPVQPLVSVVRSTSNPNRACALLQLSPATLVGHGARCRVGCRLDIPRLCLTTSAKDLAARLRRAGVLQ